MTRLTEALERARNAGTAAASYSEPRLPTADSTPPWSFDEPDPGVNPNATLEGPGGWPLAAPGAAEPLSPPAAAASVSVLAPVRTASRPAAERRPVAQAARFSDAASAKLVVASQRDNVTVEQYRRLAAVLHHAQNQRQTRSVMIASAVPAEGKTLTATNLALTLSRSYQKRVLLIDADLRRPGLSAVFNIPGAVGLTTSLRQPELTKLPVEQVFEDLWLLPAGQPDANPTGLLTSDAMKQLITEAVAQFDWVILDTPPVGLIPDANLLAAMIDAAFLVVNAGKTPYPLVQKAVEAIGPERVLGVVLNRADRSSSVDIYNYYSYYDTPAGEGVSGHSGSALG